MGLTSISDALGITDSEGAIDAINKSTGALTQAGGQAISTIEGAQQKYADPFFQSGVGALGRAEDLIGGRRMAYTPQEQSLLDDALERVNREAAYTGGLGGGQRLKRLQQSSLGIMDQIRERQIGRELGLAGMGQQAGLAGLQSAGQVAGLQTDIGSAQASGIMGRERASNMGTDVVLAGLGAGLGGYFGGPMGAQAGAQAGGAMGQAAQPTFTTG